MPITKKNILFLNEPIKILIMLHCVPRIKHTSILEVKWTGFIFDINSNDFEFGIASLFIQYDFRISSGNRMSHGRSCEKKYFFQFCFVQFLVPYIAIYVRCKFSSWSIFFKCYWFSPFNRITVMVLSYFKEYI